MGERCYLCLSEKEADEPFWLQCGRCTSTVCRKCFISGHASAPPKLIIDFTSNTACKVCKEPFCQGRFQGDTSLVFTTFQEGKKYLDDEILERVKVVPDNGILKLTSEVRLSPSIGFRKMMFFKGLSKRVSEIHMSSSILITVNGKGFTYSDMDVDLRANPDNGKRLLVIAAFLFEQQIIDIINDLQHKWFSVDPQWEDVHMIKLSVRSFIRKYMPLTPATHHTLSYFLGMANEIIDMIYMRFQATRVKRKEPDS